MCLIKSTTVEPCYNEDLGTMKITLSYMYQGIKQKKYEKQGPAKLPCSI